MSLEVSSAEDSEDSGDSAEELKGRRRLRGPLEDGGHDSAARDSQVDTT